MSQIIVSDTSTLITLEKQLRLSLLCHLFQTVLMPETVYKELLLGLENKTAFSMANCLHIVKVMPSSRLNNLAILLDQGEAEAIELAMTKQLALIIDEKKGRKVAQSLGITITGLAGLLILAVKKGVLSPSEAQDVLDRAIKDGHRLSVKLYEQVVQALIKLSNHKNKS